MHDNTTLIIVGIIMLIVGMVLTQSPTAACRADSTMCHDYGPGVQ